MRLSVTLALLFAVRLTVAPADGPAAIVDGDKAYRTLEGVTERSDAVEGGAALSLRAPWRGQDVVLRLHNSDTLPSDQRRRPLFRTVDLNCGESREVALTDGKKLTINCSK
jgi:hypothetical protein